jgi:hypothetical protein
MERQVESGFDLIMRNRNPGSRLGKASGWSKFTVIIYCHQAESHFMLFFQATISVSEIPWGDPFRYGTGLGGDLFSTLYLTPSMSQQVTTPTTPAPHTAEFAAQPIEVQVAVLRARYPQQRISTHNLIYPGARFMTHYITKMR